MRFMTRSLMGLFLLSITLGLLALAGQSVRTSLAERWARDTPSRPARERIFAVNVLRAEPHTVTPKIETFGEIRSRRALDIRAPGAGTVVALSPNFVEGGRVSKGEVLVQVDPADAHSALQSVRTDKTEAGGELQDADAAKKLATDDVAAALEQSDLRQAALARQQNLRARGVGTASAVEAAALSAAASKQSVLAKRQALAQANARFNRARTSLLRLDLRLKDAQRRLDDTTISAEFSGVLSAVSVVAGGLVSPNEKLARLIDPNALEVAFRVSNPQFSRLSRTVGGAISGQVLVSLGGASGKTTTSGVIDRVAASVGIGQTGRQMFARLNVTGQNRLRPGDFVSVEVGEPALENVLILPAVAVDADGKVLVLGDNERLQEKSVTILRRQRNTVIVRSKGLVGLEIVKSRSPLIGAGIRVRPLRQTGAGQASASQASLPPAEFIALTPARREKLLGFVRDNKFIPKDAKKRMLAKLKQEKVPAAMVSRIEKRMGG